MRWFAAMPPMRLGGPGWGCGCCVLLRPAVKSIPRAFDLIDPNLNVGETVLVEVVLQVFAFHPDALIGARVPAFEAVGWVRPSHLVVYQLE